MLKLDAGSSTATTARKRRPGQSHKRGGGVASKAAEEAVRPWIAFALQGVSEIAAAQSEITEVALIGGGDDESGEYQPGEADILALLPSRLLAKTMLGKQLAKVLLDDAQKATLAVLMAYALRVGPALAVKVRENNVARKQNAPPRRVAPVKGQQAQPINIPVTGQPGGPGVILPGGVTVGPWANPGASHGDFDGLTIPVPRL
jgi:hypothetical protein